MGHMNFMPTSDVLKEAAKGKPFVFLFFPATIELWNFVSGDAHSQKKVLVSYSMPWILFCFTFSRVVYSQCFAVFLFVHPPFVLYPHSISETALYVSSPYFFTWMPHSCNRPNVGCSIFTKIKRINLRDIPVEYFSHNYVHTHQQLTQQLLFKHT